MRAGRMREALPVAERAVAGARTCLPGHALLASLLLQLGRIAESLPRNEAATLIDELARTAGTDPRLLFALGLTCGRVGLYDKAETVFSTLLARVPGDFDVLYNLGLAGARAGHYDRAQRTFEAALKARPNDVDTLYELGRVDLQQALEIDSRFFRLPAGYVVVT